MKESKLPYASNKEIADEKVGKWLSAALEDPSTCGAMKDDVNEWFRAIEEERLRSKKKLIHDELYDKVKMEMFKASSALEGIEYDKIPGTIKNMSREQLDEYAWWLYKRVGVLERERKFSKISRVEVIGSEGREYVRYFKDDEYMDWDLQDDDRTLKIFIEENK